VVVKSHNTNINVKAKEFKYYGVRVQMPKHKKIKTPIGGIVKIKNYLHGKTQEEISELQKNALINLGKINIFGQIGKRKNPKTIVSDLISVENGESEYSYPDGVL